MKLVVQTSLKDLLLVTVMLSLLSLHLLISLNWSEIFLGRMIKRFKEIIQKMDQLKQLFLCRAYLQIFILMIYSQQLKVILFFLGSVIHKHKTVGQSFWRSCGLGLMLTMKEQLQDGSMKSSHSLLDYLQRIIFLLNTMPIKLGL